MLIITLYTKEVEVFKKTIKALRKNTNLNLIQ